MSFRVPEDRGYVYFVQADNGLVKIGFTDKPLRKRYGQLVTGSPVALKLLGWIAAPRRFEGYMHRRFARLRQHGEWFLPGDRLLYLVRRWGKSWEAADAREKGREMVPMSFEEWHRKRVADMYGANSPQYIDMFGIS